MLNNIFIKKILPKPHTSRSIQITAIGLFLCLIFTFIFWIISWSSHQSDLENSSIANIEEGDQLNEELENSANSDIEMGDQMSEALALCSDFSDDDFIAHLPHTEPLNTHFNQAVLDRAISGLHESNFTLENLGHDPQAILAYVEKTSFSQDENVQISYAKGTIGNGSHIETVILFDASREVEVQRYDMVEQGLLLDYHACFSYRYEGCRFPNSLELNLADLEPGAYYAYLVDDQGSSSAPIFFNLRETDEELARQEVFVLLSDTTWHAYNSFGGGSLYGIHEGVDTQTLTIGQNFITKLYSVGFGRPQRNLFFYTRYNSDIFHEESTPELLTPRQVLERCIATRQYNRARMHQCFYNTRPTPISNLAFSWQLIEAGVDFSILSMDDFLNYAPEHLSENSTVIITGHNEYWTQEMRMALSSYLQRGGNVLNMSGNVDWWQINIEDQTMYQDQGGLYRSNACNLAIPKQYQNSGQTGYFIRPGTEALLGLSYRYGGYSLTYSVDLGLIEPVAPQYEVEMTVLETSHPLFEKIDINDRDVITVGPLFMADEIDGMPLLNDGLNPYFEFDAASNIRPLARMVVFAANHISGDGGAYLRDFVEPAVIVEYQPFSHERSGRVLSIGAIGTAYSLLEADPQAIRLLLNGVRYLQRPNDQLTDLEQ